VQSARLIYTSAAVENCSAHQIKKILEISIKHNTTNGITGILYYSSEYFMQYLEGSRENVESTYARIARDDRHHALRVVDRETIQQREFEAWQMAYVPKSAILTPLNLRFMRGTEFNPGEITAAEAMQLTLKLRELLPRAHYEASAPND
jgi:hypothetical protein